MADNLTLNAGSGGASLKTDQLADNSHVQYIKLLDGTADSAAVIPGDATNGLKVQVTTSGLPTGAATADKQDTGNTSLGTIAGAVSGTEMQVDVVTLPASIALPTGAATAAKQDTGNTALATLAGAVSGTEVQVDVLTLPASIALPTGAATEATLSTLSGKVTACNTGAVTIGAAIPAGDNNIGNVDLASPIPSGTNNIGDVDIATVPAPLSTTGGGTEATALRVTIASDSTGVVSVDDGGGILTVDGTVALGAGTAAIGKLAANSGVDIGDVDVLSVPAPLSTTGGGTEATALRVTIASDSTGVVSIDDNGGAITVDGSVTIGSALPAGTNNIGDVDIASALPAGTNLLGAIGLDPRTSGGLSFTSTISAASTNLTQVKATAGQVYGIFATNINAAVRYLKVYNAASADVTVGSTTAVLTLPIPASATGAGFFLKWEHGLAFGTAISFALTTGVAANDTGAVAANELVVSFFYK